MTAFATYASDGRRPGGLLTGWLGRHAEPPRWGGRGRFPALRRVQSARGRDTGSHDLAAFRGQAAGCRQAHSPSLPQFVAPQRPRGATARQPADRGGTRAT